MNIAILTASDTAAGKGTQSDVCGGLVRDLFIAERHHVTNWEAVPSDREKIVIAVARLTRAQGVDAMIVISETGLGKKDVALNAVRKGFEKELENFAPLFTMLMYEELGAQSILHRSAAGVINGKLVFCLPSVPKACEVSLKKIVLPGLEKLYESVKQ